MYPTASSSATKSSNPTADPRSTMPASSIRRSGSASVAPSESSKTLSKKTGSGIRWIQRQGASAMHSPDRLKLDSKKYVKLLGPHFATPSQMATPEDAYVLNIIGGGPMGTESCLAIQDRILTHLDAIMAIESTTGRELRLGINVIDAQPKENVVQGNAWSGAHGLASMNTGFEEKAIAQKDLGEWVTKRQGVIDSHLRSDPMISSLFKSGFDAAYKKSNQQQVTHHRAFLPRSIGGLYYLSRFASLVTRGQSQLGSRLAIKIVPDTAASGIALGDQTSTVTLENNNLKSAHEAQQTMIATGTTLKEPITDPAVARHCYQGPMNSTSLQQDLQSKGLLDAQGMLVAGTRVGLGGTQLSLFDQIIALAPAMGLWEKADGDPGYRVSPQARAKYQGALTFVSSEAGSLVNPRTALEPAGTSTQEYTISNSTELWSLAMTDAPYGLDAYSHMAYLCMARTLDVGIDDVIKRCATTETLAVEQMKDVQHFFKHMRAGTTEQSAHTYSGGFRQHLNANYEGKVASQDPASALDNLKSVFGFAEDIAGTQQFIQAWMSMATEHGASSEVMGAYTRMFQFVAASPAHIQVAAGMLIEAGIAQHVPCRYEKLQPRSDDRPGLQMQGAGQKPLDIFIVSRTFSAEENPLYRSLGGTVKPVHPEKAYPATTTWGRRVVDTEGKTLNVMDYGLSGTGVKVDGMTFGATTIDINNHPSAIASAASASVFVLGPALLAHVDHPDPQGAFDDIVADKTRIRLQDPKATAEDINDAVHQAVKRTEVARQAKVAGANAKSTARLADLAMQSRPATPELQQAVGETLGPDAEQRFLRDVEAKRAELAQDASKVQGTIDHFTASRRDLTTKEADAIMAEVLAVAGRAADSPQAKRG